jgi:serine/threonine protein kinase/Tfp pilus assembly protein PilF
VSADLQDRLQSTLGATYTLERELGGGGMSRVFLAEERQLGRRVVVKVLPPELATEISIERFRREIQLAARLQHPHIVPLLGAGETGGIVYYTMPWVDGESLRARLERERQLAIDDALAIAREVADALAHAHANGVVHRDIKPDNVLLSAGHAMVVDFGIARAVQAAGTSEALTMTGLTLGTPLYMSPEQAAGERDVDARADIYSLGCVLYEMLAGEPPFTGPNAQAVIAKRLTTDAPRITSVRAAVPPWLERALSRALQRVPADRFSTATELAKALAERGVSVELRRASPERCAVAVLPFANMSSDPENEYFSDGISEDIISQLSKIGRLKVISRTSTMRYKRTEKPMREIASELGVEAILEGSVRRAGNRVRVVAQLIDATGDEHLWSETYDRDLTDVFAIQSDLALQVASALRTVLTPGEKERVERKPTDNVDAYNWYLLGRFALNKRSADGIARATHCFEAAIAADPSFALAHAGLADTYMLAAIGYGAAPSDALPRAKRAALAAVRIDESLADAHTSLGYVHLNYDWDFFAAERELRRAIDLNPSSAQAHEWLAHAYLYVGRWDADDKGVAHLRIALDLDPLSVVLTTEQAWPYLYKREFERGVIYLNRALAMDPDFALARNNLAYACEHTGQPEKAFAEHLAASRLSGGAAFITAFLARAHVRRGEFAEARAILRDLTEQATQGAIVNLFVAFVHDALGEADDVIRWLERAYEAREPTLVFLHWGEWIRFETVWNDSRFRSLLDRVGMVEQARRAQAK